MATAIAVIPIDKSCLMLHTSIGGLFSFESLGCTHICSMLVWTDTLCMLHSYERTQTLNLSASPNTKFEAEYHTIT